MQAAEKTRGAVHTLGDSGSAARMRTLFSSIPEDISLFFPITSCGPGISFNSVTTVDGSSPLGYFRLENPLGFSEVNGYFYNYSGTGASVVSGIPADV
jgi:hypothetical protein